MIDVMFGETRTNASKSIAGGRLKKSMERETAQQKSAEFLTKLQSAVLDNNYKKCAE